MSSHYRTIPAWVAAGVRLDDDRVGVLVPSTIRSMEVETETEDYSSYGPPSVVKPLLSRVVFTVTMDEYKMIHAPTYGEAMYHLPDLCDEMGLTTPTSPRGDLTAAMHTLFTLASEHVSTKEEARALEKVAEFLGY